MTRVIDAHSHVLNQDYYDILAKHGALKEDGFPLPKWDAQTNLEMMEKGGVVWTLMSLSSPHPFFGDAAETAAFCRGFNEFCAEQVREHPDKFGFCAVLPLPDVDAAIEEAIYALEELGAKGVKLASNSRGQYLGDAELDPLFKELNKRGSVVILHPHRPTPQQEGIFSAGPVPLYEFLADTTRGILNMIAHDVPVRYPNVKIVVPHCGSFLPNIAGRVKMLQPILVNNGMMDPVNVDDNLSRLYYDTAGSPVPYMLKLLLTITTPDHVMYGGDYPFTNAEIVLANLEKLKDFLANDPELAPHADAILYANAAKMFGLEG